VKKKREGGPWRKKGPIVIGKKKKKTGKEKGRVISKGNHEGRGEGRPSMNHGEKKKEKKVKTKEARGDTCCVEKGTRSREGKKKKGIHELERKKDGAPQERGKKKAASPWRGGEGGSTQFEKR